MFGHHDFRFGHIENLPGLVPGGAHLRRHPKGAVRAALEIMVDDKVRILDLAEGLSPMTFLSTRFFAQRFPQALGPRRLLQSVTRRWLAAVAAVQSQSTFQFGHVSLQCSILQRQRCKSFLLRNPFRQQLFDQLLNVDGNFHPTLESDSPLPHQPLHTARVNSPQHHSTGDGHPRISDNVPVHLGSYEKYC